MTRFRLTLMVAITLSASYRIYAQCLNAMTSVQVPAPQRPVAARNSPLPRTFIEVAEQTLPDEKWMQHAKYAYERSDEVFLYAEQVEFLDDEDGNRVQFSPFALVCKSVKHPERQPHVIRCEKARVQFEKPFRMELGAASPGRIVSASLDGAVVIRGPDGLAIEGRDFRFSEASLLLYSDHPVRFAYGPAPGEHSEVQGSAHGVQLNLTHTFEPTLGRDMPRIGGIEVVRLQRDVRLSLTYEDKSGRKSDNVEDDTEGVEGRGLPPKLSHAVVSSDGILEFKVAEGTVTMEENVRVERPTGGEKHPEQADRLRCNWLALLFEKQPRAPRLVPDPGDSAESGVVTAAATSAGERTKHKKKTDDADEITNPLAGLSFRKLRAQGDRAVLQSDEQDLVANMHYLEFDGETGEAILLDNEAVRVKRGTTKLMSPQIIVRRASGTHSEMLHCTGGAGQLEQRNEDDGKLQLTAEWNEQLRIEPDPQTGLLLIRADGEARLWTPGQTGILADHLALWVQQEEGASPADPIRASSSESLARLPLKFALAEGNAVLANRQMHLKTSRLRATFESGSLPPAPALARQPGDKHKRGDQASEPPEPPEPQWIVQAGEVDVRLLQDPQADPKNPRVEVAEATARGAILVTQTPPAPPAGSTEIPEDPLSLSGSRLHLVNAGDVNQVVELSGAPAHLRQGERHLEAQQIILDRRRNTITVPGQGMLQYPVEADLNGDPLVVGQNGGPPGAPMLLDVHWQNGMTFDGAQATFIEHVVLRLNESLLRCEEMIVNLDRPIDFGARQEETTRPAIKEVRCRDGVQVEMYEWKENRLVGIRRGELAEFVLDYVSGDFRGRGPGVINDWSRGGSRRVAVAPKAVAKANQPQKSDDLDWDYANVRFSQYMKGNYKERITELHGHVRMLYAPVEHVNDVFSRSELSGDSPSAKNAVWVGCDTLSVTMHPWPEDPAGIDPAEAAMTSPADESVSPREKYFAMIGGSERCELEGQLFRAVADTLSYDQSKELFTLKGSGLTEASIYYWERVGGEQSRVPGQSIQFVPSQNKFNLDGSRGIQGVH